jgi:raffinose/stachyose/melibiose transport system permease protein
MSAATSSRSVRGRRAVSAARSVFYTVLAGFFSLFVLTPVFLVVVTALKDRGQIVRDPLGLPVVYIWQNFPRAWENGHFGLYFRNSLMITLPVVVGVLAFSLLAAYAFALLSFRGKNALFTLLLVGLTIPLGVLAIPLFYEMLALRLLDTHWALILPQIGISMPFGILLLRSFIQDLPREILDAGRIDGCTDWGLLRHIVLPLSRPALFSLLIFSFTWSWNEFLLAIVLLQTEAARTLPLGLNFFRGRYSTDFPMLMAGATITFIPVMIVYLIFQRHFIKGIAAGSLSGV